jgi:hypothetical protein
MWAKIQKIYDEDLSINGKEIGGNDIIILSFLYNFLVKRLISNLIYYKLNLTKTCNAKHKLTPLYSKMS